MNYENVDENATYKIACENVKKIVNAIKALKIKYYPNFDRISEEDKTTFHKLQQQLEKISEENGLNDLKVALMEEISAKFDYNVGNEGEAPKTDNNMLQACYGAIDAQAEALSKGKIGQAIRCQQKLRECIEEIERTGQGQQLLELINKYKRERIGQLCITAEKIKDSNLAWKDKIKSFLRPADVESRKKIAEEIASLSKNTTRETPDMVR